MQVSAHYGLPLPVPFLDVHIDRDNRLFLDPSAIRNGSDPRSLRAHKLIVDFFTEVLRLRKSPTSLDHLKGQALLNNLHEPNETRLGMSASGVGGKAFGAGLAGSLWSILRTNPAAQAAVLTRLEQLPIFIERVGPDLISDLTTRVLFEVLADFTSDMMIRYPALAAGSTVSTTAVYDAASQAWVNKSFDLPFVAPHQLLLIPKEWVYWRLLMEADPFYNRFATETIQDERETVVRGRRLRPSKKALNKEFADHRDLNTVQAVKYKRAEDRDLVLEYQAYVDTNFDPLSDDETQRRLGQ